MVLKITIKCGVNLDFGLVMDLSDDSLMSNRDWDPSYLSLLFSEDFNDFSDLWSNSDITDDDLVQAENDRERYCPITEDISLDDETLRHAVESIEKK